MIKHNFSKLAERGVAEYYAGTMHKISQLSSGYGSSKEVAVAYAKHRRATQFEDYIVYCQQMDTDGFNIYIDNDVVSDFINIKMNSGGANDDFTGDWHLRATSRGVQYFFPIYNTYPSEVTSVQFGEIIIEPDGTITQLYDKNRDFNSFTTGSPSPMTIVDVYDRVYMAQYVAGGLLIANLYYEGIETEATTTDAYLYYYTFSGETLQDEIWGLTSTEGDENLIFINTDVASYAFSIAGNSDDFLQIYLKPAYLSITNQFDEEFTINIGNEYSVSSNSFPSGYEFDKAILANGDEVPLWYSKNYGLSSNDQSDGAVVNVSRGYANYPSVSSGYYKWIGYDFSRAYTPNFDPSDQFYKCHTIIGSTSQNLKCIRQFDFDASYEPVMIPIQGTHDRFITYYGYGTIHYYYLTYAVPNLIENDKGLFYPTFVGEEEGTITLDGENSALRYERIGNIVHIFGVVSPVSSTAVGALKLTNLPYPISNEFFDTDFTLDQAGIKLTPIRLSGSADYYTLYFCTSQSDHTLTSAATAMGLGRWAFNFRYMTN